MHSDLIKFFFISICLGTLLTVTAAGFFVDGYQARPELINVLGTIIVAFIGADWARKRGGNDE